MASGPDGTIYFAQNASPTGFVYASAAGGTATVLVGSGLSDDIGGIVVGGDGNIYVADRGNSVIKRVTKAGVVTVVVGTSDLPIATVPGGLPARVNSPSGMTLLSPGTPVSLAVVDAFEHAVLRVDLP